MLEWSENGNGNLFTKVNGCNLVVFKEKDEFGYPQPDKVKWVLDGRFSSDVFGCIEAAIDDAIEVLQLDDEDE